jgi:hypothetical protein
LDVCRGELNAYITHTFAWNSARVQEASAQKLPALAWLSGKGIEGLRRKLYRTAMCHLTLQNIFERSKFIKSSMYCSALKNILLAALVNQFSPISYAQRLCIAAAKIVSPPRGTIMLCDIIHAEARQRVLCRRQKECRSHRAFSL